MENTNVHPNILSLRNEPEKIRLLATFFKKVLNQDIFIVIDSLEENSYLIYQNGNNFQNGLQAFVNSFINNEFLDLAHGSQAYLNLFIFLPKHDEINLNLLRNTKIPIEYLNWSPHLLNGYADFVLENLRNNSKNECKRLPSFKELVSGSLEETTNRIRTPRNLNILMNNLIKAMNTNCLKRTTPFVPIESDIDEAISSLR